MQNSRTMRRLAADHGALHSQPLPPNYLFPPGADADDLTELDILLAGPSHTPFAAGVWKLHLTIPTDYPQRPPTANFRTPIFHPNVEPQTGGVCVETLKRDWDSKLTLRDVLITISCLLIQPNPDSALNAEAGSLIQENYEAFARRATLMTSIHALVPKALQEDAREAQTRGQETVQEVDDDESTEVSGMPAAPPRRRRIVTARQRGVATGRRSNGSPTGGLDRRRQHIEQSNPVVVQTRSDDVFGGAVPAQEETIVFQDDDSSIMIDADQENDEARSPTKGKSPKVATPRRPHGAAVPLGELTLEDPQTDSSEDESGEAEYPPSPKKFSPTKSPAKRRPQQQERGESSRDAVARGNAANITPPNNPFSRPLAHDSPLHLANPATSPRKGRMLRETPKRAPLFSASSTPREYAGIFKARSPSSAEKNTQERRRKDDMEKNLWDLCGRDIRRWNSGDFDGEPFAMKAGRW